MKIGIDARPLSHDLTGISRYTLNVLKELFIQQKDVEWFLYSDKPIRFKFPYSNVHVCTGKNRNLFKGPLFSQILFPFWAIKDELDVFWSPRHHLPLILFFSKKIKKIVTIHDIVWKRHPETMSKPGLILENLLFIPSIKIANKIITVSRFTESELAKEFPFTAGKTVSIPLQSFISNCQLESIKPENTEGKFLLFVGTLEPRKNLNNLLIAFHQIQLENNELQLIIVGKDGWGNINISTIIEKLKLSNKVKVTGFISDNELLSLYKHCEILVMPSIYEGFGLPALEALSLKRKVVVSKFNAISEIQGDNIFITELDTKSIAKTIKDALASNPKNLAKIGNDWHHVAESTFNILKINATKH